MSDARTIDITDSILDIGEALMQGGRGFEAELALSTDKDRGVAMAVGLVLAGVPLNRIAASALLMRGEGRRDRVLETFRDHGIDRAYSALMNMGDDRRTPVVIAAMVAAELLEESPAKVENLLRYCCLRAWTDPYTHLHADAERIRERNPYLVTARPGA